MKIIISPAKTFSILDRSLENIKKTEPIFPKQTKKLITELQKISQENLEKLMKISPKIAELNLARYQDWEKNNLKRRQSALGIFDGDVYRGLQVENFSQENWQTAQEKLLILSGLYGILRPLDLIQPYRLEMGTRLKIDEIKNLYELWQPLLIQYFSQEKDEIIINLASQEYSKAIQFEKISQQIITPVFKTWKNNQWKIIAIHAKRARGLMANFIIKNNLKNINDLQKFSQENYNFLPKESTKNELVFGREQI